MPPQVSYKVSSPTVSSRETETGIFCQASKSVSVIPFANQGTQVSFHCRQGNWDTGTLSHARPDAVRCRIERHYLSTVLHCMSYSVGLGFAHESSDFDFVVIVRLGVREEKAYD
jgi:hypothetical protein